MPWRGRIAGMRYRLRTLLIVSAIAPPVLAGLWFALQSSLWIELLSVLVGLVAFLILSAKDLVSTSPADGNEQERRKSQDGTQLVWHLWF